MSKMTNVATADLSSASMVPSKGRIMAYWITTGLTAAEAIAGGLSDVLRLSYVEATMNHLGYPGYFTVLLGAWKLCAAVALLLPKYPRLKEWAYAGIVFNMTGAVASHLAVGDGAATVAVPIVFMVLAVASWALRPPARRGVS